MCFKRNNDERLLHLRSFVNASGNYYININKDKNDDRLLVINLTNNKGIINIKLTNLDTKEEIIKDNPISGTYEFDIKKDYKYQLLIKREHANGNYKITIKRK